MRMRLRLGDVDLSTSISFDVSAAGIELKIVTVIIDKVLTLDSTSFKMEVMLSLQNYDERSQTAPCQSDYMIARKKTRSIISKLFYQRYYRVFLLVKTCREIMDCLSQDLEVVITPKILQFNINVNFLLCRESSQEQCLCTRFYPSLFHVFPLFLN